MTEYSATTFQARCRLAASYVDRYLADPKSYWVAIGKASPWLDENNPPYPAITVNRVPELIGFVYVHTCKSVYETDIGIIKTLDKNYELVNSTNPNLLASAKANKLYFEAILPPEATPLSSTYRIKALCTNVVFANTPNIVGPELFISGSEVLDYFVDWIVHHKAVENDGQTNQVVQIIREF